jgi:hypothetical protein
MMTMKDIKEMHSNPMGHDGFIPESFEFSGKRRVHRVDRPAGWIGQHHRFFVRMWE